jgi:hypothetical protein
LRGLTNDVIVAIGCSEDSGVSRGGCYKVHFVADCNDVSWIHGYVFESPKVMHMKTNLYWRSHPSLLSPESFDGNNQ